MEMNDMGKMGDKMEAGMSFSWGKNRRNSGESLNVYLVDLLLVFLVSLITECLSRTRFIGLFSNNVVAGLVQTVMYGVRTALAYWVMLAVMSFDLAVFLAAVAGYSIGFLVFGSRVFDKPETVLYQKTPDLPPLTC